MSVFLPIDSNKLFILCEPVLCAHLTSVERIVLTHLALAVEESQSRAAVPVAVVIVR